MILDPIIKECAKENNLHHKGPCSIWYKTDDLLFIATSIFVSAEEQKWVCAFKPLYSDELLWKILETFSKTGDKWEDFKKYGTPRRIDGVCVAPAKILYSYNYKLCSSEEEQRALYNRMIEEFIEKTKAITEADYSSETEVSMTNILNAIHEGDKARAKKLAWKIKPWPGNKKPSDERLFYDDLHIWRSGIFKYLKKGV